MLDRPYRTKEAFKAMQEKRKEHAEHRLQRIAARLGKSVEELTAKPNLPPPPIDIEALKARQPESE